jgi:ribonuclease HI
MTQNETKWPQDLLTLAQIPVDWNVIIAGDGSGSRYGYPGGWAAVIFDRESGFRKLLQGCTSDTTVNIMELSPYIYAMLWYTRGPGKALHIKIKAATPVGIAPRLINVHVVTDCKIIADQGNNTVERETNLPLWRTIEAYERLGYKMYWHHVERELLAVNRLCDDLSKEMRRAILQLPVPNIYDDQYRLQQSCSAEQNSVQNGNISSVYIE